MKRKRKKKLSREEEETDQNWYRNVVRIESKGERERLRKKNDAKKTTTIAFGH